MDKRKALFAALSAATVALALLTACQNDAAPLATASALRSVS